MMMLIVLLHTVFDEVELRGVYVICEIATPVFFFISSYLLFQHWNLSWHCYSRKLISRIKSLWIPFVIFNSLIIPYYYIKTYWLPIPNQRELPLSFSDTITSCLFGIPETLNSPLWFVRELLVFVVFSPIVGWIVMRGKYVTGAVFILVLTLGHYASYYSILYWLPCLILGYCCALYEKEVLHLLTYIKRRNWAKRLITITFFGGLIIASHNLQQASDQYIPYYIYRLSAPIWMVLLYTLYDRILPERLVSNVRPYTFFIYCTHTLFINIVNTIIKNMFPVLPCEWNRTIVFVISFVLVTYTGKILCHFKPLWMVLTGFRSYR